jgi:hypothetical protein
LFEAPRGEVADCAACLCSYKWTRAQNFTRSVNSSFMPFLRLSPAPSGIEALRTSSLHLIGPAVPLGPRTRVNAPRLRTSYRDKSTRGGGQRIRPESRARVEGHPLKFLSTWGNRINLSLFFFPFYDVHSLALPRFDKCIGYGYRPTPQHLTYPRQADPCISPPSEFGPWIHRIHSDRK